MAVQKELEQLKKPGSTPEEAQKEASARTYLKELYKEIVAEEKAQEEVADKELREEISNVAAMYSDFDDKKVLAVMEEFSIENVETGYKAWKKMSSQVEQAKEDTKKDIISKPKNPSAVKTSDDFGSKFSEDKTKGKSLWELAEMAKREAGF